MGDVRDKYGRQARTEGNPNTSDADREASRVGSARTPDDIPTQDSVSNGRVVPGNVDPTIFRPSTDETRGKYRLATAQRPPIAHDNGHLRMGKRSATAGDYASLAKWNAMLEVGEGLRPDLTDALAAYRHFLEGKGKPRNFSYERYTMSDASGQETLRNAILDFQNAALDLWEANGKPYQFPVTGPAIPCGANPKAFPYLSRFFPYPATENWQKAIGAHTIWLSGEVKAWPGSTTVFEAVMILHAEDRYNFNPGDADIATGIEDSENGKFERTGLAHQYDNLATLQRYLKWTGLDLGVELSSRPHTTRLRQPANNRRVQNRL
jgi:hypothetical protein